VDNRKEFQSHEPNITDKWLQSENKLHRELDNTIVTAQQSVISTDVVGDLRKVRGSQGSVIARLVCCVGTWRQGVQMVRQVERFRA